MSKTDVRIATISFFFNLLCVHVFLQGKQQVLRRSSVVRVELAELSAELDLDILSRLESLSKAFSYCPNQTPGPGLVQVSGKDLFCEKNK